MNSPNHIADIGFLAHIVDSAFQVASIIFFIAILVTINRLRSGFSATGCLLLGVLLFLFAITAIAELRSLILQGFASFIDSLFMPFRRLFEATYCYLDREVKALRAVSHYT